MLVKPTVLELLEKVDNRFQLVVMTARRARQSPGGDKTKTEVKETSPVTLAANEIAEGKVTIVEEENKEDEQENGEEEILESKE